MRVPSRDVKRLTKALRKANTPGLHVIMAAILLGENGIESALQSVKNMEMRVKEMTQPRLL